MLYYITLTLYFTSITVAFLTSLTAYSKYNKVTYLKYFPPFLLLTLLVEIAAYIIAVNYGNNQFLFNFFSIIGFTFYFLILFKGIKNRVVKKIILTVMILYFLFALGTIFYSQNLMMFNSFSFGIGTFFIILFCIYYFRWQFFETPLEVDINRDPLVFICLGLIVFHAITFTYFSGVHIFQNFSKSFIENMTIVCMVSNYVLYGFFTTAFLINHKYSKIEVVEFPEIPKF
jgi:hypothetical protein